MDPTRRSICLALAVALSVGSPAAAQAEESGGISAIFRFFARVLGGSSGAAAGGAAAAAIAANDHRPCPDLARFIDEDRRKLPERERNILRKETELEQLERDFQAKLLGEPWAHPSDKLLDARDKQEYRIGWFDKDIRTHRADVASFNARCIGGMEAMNPREAYQPISWLGQPPPPPGG